MQRPWERYPRPIVHVATAEEADEAVDAFFGGESPDDAVIALDCEWAQMADSPPVALLQLASTHTVLLIHLAVRTGPAQPAVHTTAAQSARLRALLADRKRLKVGVAVRDDALRLTRQLGCPVLGCVDLRDVALRCRVDDATMGLRRLSEFLFGEDSAVEKAKHVQTSDWERETLTAEQTLYASQDALVSLFILDALLARRLDVADAPPGDVRERDLRSGDALTRQLRTICAGIVDVRHRSKNKSKNKDKDKDKDNGKGKDKDAPAVLATLDAPLYGQCRILAPDGTLLCLNSGKKVRWYLRQELADLVEEDGERMTIRLRFEPKSRGLSPHMRVVIPNRCVVCGADFGEPGVRLARKFVVPHDYKQYFPKRLRSHNSHDVVLLCADDHLVYNRCEASLQAALASEFDVPLAGIGPTVFVDDTLRKAISAARDLAAHASGTKTLHPAHLASALAIARPHLVASGDLAPDAPDDAFAPLAALKALGARSYLTPNEAHIPHARAVVSQLMEADDIDASLGAFARRWRQFFLDNMQPRFLPEFWSVDHVHESTLMKEIGMTSPEYDEDADE